MSKINKNEDPDITFSRIDHDFSKDTKVLELINKMQYYSGTEFILKGSGYTLPFKREKAGYPALATMEILYKEMQKYPKNFLKTLGVKKVILTGKLVGDDTAGGAYYGLYKKLLMPLENDKPDLFPGVFHHEIYHAIDDKLNQGPRWKEWTKLNPPPTTDGKYTYLHTCGVSLYAFFSNDPMEDRAEFFAFMMCDNDSAFSGSSDQDISSSCKNGEICYKNKFRKMVEIFDKVFNIQDPSKATWHNFRIPQECL